MKSLIYSLILAVGFTVFLNAEDNPVEQVELQLRRTGMIKLITISGKLDSINIRLKHSLQEMNNFMEKAKEQEFLYDTPAVLKTRMEIMKMKYELVQVSRMFENFSEAYSKVAPDNVAD
jgi:hypothetical protein